MNLNRIKNITKILNDEGLSALALNPGPSFTYFSNLSFHLMERPVVLIFTANHEIGIVVPEFEMLKLQGLPSSIQTFPYPDNPSVWGEVFSNACKVMQLDHQTIGIEPTQMRFLELNYLQVAAPNAKFIAANELLEKVREEKDEDEVNLIFKSIEIAQNALEATLQWLKPGMTERQIANELVIQLLRAGSDPEIAFSPIVASGPNSANPHAVPSDRVVEAGDPLLFDWGARYQGYCSDLTRTFVLQKPHPTIDQIYPIVAQANEAGRLAARPGLPAGDLDAIARKVIDDAGYGKFFKTRLGHGFGLDVHETPYLYPESRIPLASGNIITIEPGIYIPDVGGVRIEDDVVITPNGCRTLSYMPRKMRIIG